MLFDVQNIGFKSGSLEVINDVSLQIEKGSVTGFLGKSGSGKTTLVKLISGILVPTSGRSLFEGKDIQEMSKIRNLIFRKRCSFVFQGSALWANQNILQNMMLPLQIHYPKMKKDEMEYNINKALEKVGFNRSLQLRPSDLSTGEQKKVAFARAVVAGPEILVLDEVIAGLDAKSAQIIMGLLHNFLEEGNSLLYVSHDNEFIKEFPGTMHVIDSGKLVRTEKNVQDVDALLDEIENEKLSKAKQE